MGYYSQVRYMTTKEGYEKIKELAPKRYKELLDEKAKEGDSIEQRDNGEVVIKEHGINCVYLKEISSDYEIVKETADGNFVMFGYDWVKWMGYDHLEHQATDWAAEQCGEPVRLLMVGENGAEEENRWGDMERVEYDLLYVGVETHIDDDDWC